MRHLVVRRVTAWLAAGMLAWAGLFAWAVHEAEPPADATGAPRPPASAADRPDGPAEASGPTPPVDLPSGEALHERHCASCHTAADLGARLRSGGETTRRRFEELLGQHGAATAEEDRRILDYLAGIGGS
jgi:mono/diheme cytochrome c family protein